MKIWLRLAGGLLAFLLCWGLAGGISEATPLNGEWKYYAPDAAQAVDMNLINLHAALRYEDSEWEPFAHERGRAPVAAGQKYLWLTTRLPQVVYYKNPVLFFSTTEEAVRVYIDNELIYSYGEFGQQQTTYGKKWHIVTLPANYKGRQLSFQLYTDHPGRLGRLDAVSLDEGIQQIRHIFQHDIFNYFALPLAAIMLFIMVMYYQVMQQRRQLYVYLAVFLLLLAAWLFASMQTVFLLWDKPVLWWRVMLSCGYLMPIFGNLMVYEALGPVQRRPVLAMIWGYGLLAAGVLCGELLGWRTMDGGISLFYSWLGISQFVVLLCLLHSALRGRRIARVLLVPSGGMSLLGVIDGLSSHFQLFYLPFFVTPLGVFFLSFFVIWLIRENIREEKRLRALTQRMAKKVTAANERAAIDALTKCFNRGKLAEAMERECNVAKYSGLPLSLLMFDIDLFKSVNDTYGHAAGDSVLVNFAMVVRQHLDARHIFVRYGGEEFVVLCRGFSLTEARNLAERIRKAVQDGKLLEDQQITCSIGVSSWQAEEPPEKFLRRADQALYLAKQQGRNRVMEESQLLSEQAGAK